MVINVSAAGFLALGLRYEGFHPSSEQQNHRRFRSFCGVDPGVCAELFIDLQTLVDGAIFGIGRHDASYLLLALHWLFCYPTISSLAGKFQLAEKAARSWAAKYTKAIQSLKEHKVRWLIVI